MKQVEVIARLAMLAAGKPESEYPNLMHAMIEDAIVLDHDVRDLLAEVSDDLVQRVLPEVRKSSASDITEILQRHAFVGGLSMLEWLPSLKAIMKKE